VLRSEEAKSSGERFCGWGERGFGLIRDREQS